MCTGSFPEVKSYTSTPHTDRTACTEPQCLYKGALYLYLIKGTPPIAVECMQAARDSTHAQARCAVTERYSHLTDIIYLFILNL